jgi:uncharacterized protein
MDFPEPDVAHWRDATREAMYRATIAEAARRYDTTTPVFNYRWEHVLAVHRLAMKLARLTGADAEVVEAAVWLHDIAKEAGGEHPALGADFARTFLPNTDFPADKIEQVAEAIAAHMGLWREQPLQKLENQVLWDADKLAKLGLTAAFHWMGMGFANGDPVTTEELLARGRDAEWQEKTVASMHTDVARQAAAQRLRTFKSLWQTLEAELEARDLNPGT